MAYRCGIVQHVQHQSAHAIRLLFRVKMGAGAVVLNATLQEIYCTFLKAFCDAMSEVKRAFRWADGDDGDRPQRTAMGHLLQTFVCRQ